MIISSLEIQNVKSIGEKVELHFEPDINIFIGANGSGKSNVMDILNTVLHTYFIWHWQENIEFDKITYKKENLSNFFDLPKHYDMVDANQEISIEMEFVNDDLDNIRIIRDCFFKITQTEKNLLKESAGEIEGIFNPLLINATQDDLETNCKQKFTFNAKKLSQDSGESQFGNYSNAQKLWFRYLNYFEKVKYLINKYNEKPADGKKIKDLKCNFKFFPPNRFHSQGQNTISLPNQSMTQKYKESKEKTSQKISSDIAFSGFCFSLKFNELNRDEKKFQECDQVKEVRELLKTVGKYDFEIENENKRDNRYKFQIKYEEQKINFDNLSSGEKEVLNFIFTLSALDLKEACVLIDEPEIHLHPQWQNKLIKLFRKLHEDRNIQFIISTHSPVFVSKETITNIFRIYKPHKQTQIIPKEKTKVWEEKLGKEEDLIDIITYSNNSKLFFANKVVLVEGITDEIIFSYLMRTLGKDEENIEVVNVNGKENFIKYIKFLDNFKIIPTVICDLDNLWKGKLLKGQAVLGPLRNSITEFWKQREGELNTLSQYLNHKTIKEEITNKEIREKLLEIVRKVKNKKEISSDEQTFIESWFEKCIDKKKIFDELKIDKIYEPTDRSIVSLKTLCEKIATSGLKVGGVKCPIYIIREGTIENYAEDIKHGKNGAFKLLGKIKEYIKSGKNNNQKIEELKDIILKV